MVEAGKVVIGIFTAVGILAITALFLYLIAKAIGKYKPPKKPDFPSANYMEKVGAKCPAGWVFKGEMTDDNGRQFDMCQNMYNIPVCRDWIGEGPDGAGPGCYSAPGKIAVFPKIKDWDDYLKKNLPDTNRCHWINRCGPPSETAVPGGHDDQSTRTCANTPPASWIGISDRC